MKNKDWNVINAINWAGRITPVGKLHNFKATRNGLNNEQL